MSVCRRYGVEFPISLDRISVHAKEKSQHESAAHEHFTVAKYTQSEPVPKFIQEV